MIAIVGISKNESDVVSLWLDHHRAEGIEHFFIADASDDGTREILEAADDVTVVVDEDQYVRQAARTNELIEIAAAEGAEWLLPVDMDEFVYAVDGRVVAKTLQDCPYDKLYLRVWPHQSWVIRFEAAHRLGKVAFRYSSDVRVAFGNHETNLPGGTPDILAMRELKYRNFQHYLRKTAERCASLDPFEAARGHGAHHQWLGTLTRQQMAEEWIKLNSAAVITDPIPSHIHPEQVSTALACLSAR